MTRNELLESIQIKAEGYFERGEFFCSESVVHTINEFLNWPFPEELTKIASAFPVGMGKAGCLCGAVSGGQIALGMVYGREHGNSMNPKMFPLASELHDFIKKEYKSTCCRIITKNFEFASPERKAHCIKITGLVARWVAEKILDDNEAIDKFKIQIQE